MSVRLLCVGALQRDPRGGSWWSLRRWRADAAPETSWCRAPQEMWSVQRLLDEPIGEQLARARQATMAVIQ